MLVFFKVKKYPATNPYRLWLQGGDELLHQHNFGGVVLGRGS